MTWDKVSLKVYSEMDVGVRCGVLIAVAYLLGRLNGNSILVRDIQLYAFGGRIVLLVLDGSSELLTRMVC